MTLEIAAVDSSGDLRRFVDVPWRLIDRDTYPQWVPPLRRVVRDALDRDRNPFYERAEIQPFLALRDGRVAGRIAAVENRAHNDFHGDRIGFYGFFECEEDQETADALFDAAAWLRERGLERMRGPVDPSTNHETGLLVRGFRHRPTILTSWNPPYSPEHHESVGLEGEDEVQRLREAAALGRRATGRRADGVAGHYWLAAAAGLLAVRSGDGSRIVELGREARRHAWAVLEIDPGHGGAQNVLGRVHMQVAKLPGWKRFMARLLGAGDVVEGASWEQAERHLREAVARSPEVIYYRLDLARLLAFRERDEEAARAARELLEVPALHPFDPLLKERARTLLSRLEAAGQPSS